MIARMPSALSPRTAEIEDAFVGHWSHFGRWRHGELVEDMGTLRFETPIQQLPYNAVIRTHIGGGAEAVVQRLVERFRRRDVGFVWVDHPSATPAHLGELLIAEGVPPVEHATGMSRQLADLPPRPRRTDIRFDEVLDDRTMADYAELIFDYWNVPVESRELVAEVNRF